MKKRAIVVFTFLFAVFLVLSLQITSSASIDSEIQKLTHYAEQYETGNINYIQLLVYISSARQSMNEILGAVDKFEGGLLKQEQITPVLGEAKETAKWVWMEKEQREIKLDTEVPVWKKIIFDGMKIQLRLNAHPNLFTKNNEEKLIYRLNIETEFKKPKEQLDIESKIEEIKLLAENFNANPSSENAETLASQSVFAERTFEQYFRQSGEKCEDIMNSVFGSENKKQTQKLLVQEMTLYEAENYEAILRLEMCDECEWSWINMNMWFEGRGKFKMPKMEETKGKSDMEQYKFLEDSEFQSKTAELISQITTSLQSDDIGEAMSSSQELQILTEAWNQKSNEVWKEVDEIYKAKQAAMTEEEKQKMGENYGWIKQDQERRQLEKTMRQEKYEIRKQFYLKLFENYEKKEFYFTQEEYEKRLVEEFKEFGEEICNNNQDDNGDGKTDCEDTQCGGKICGKGALNENNSTVEVDFYCIAGTCQPKEYIVETKTSVCGNHICEDNETVENCREDCQKCPELSVIECPKNSKAIFSEYNNETGCPVKSICIQESESCQTDEDCIQSLCSKSACVENTCKLSGLQECQDSQCNTGQEKVKTCSTGENLVAEICDDGIWISTGQVCAGGEATEQITEQKIVAEQCQVKEDCGNENDVCSNGKCITIVDVIQVEETAGESGEMQTEEHQESSPGTETSPEAAEIEGEGEESGAGLEEPTTSQDIGQEIQEEQSSEESEPAREEPSGIDGAIISPIKLILSLFKPTKVKMTGLVTDESAESVEVDIISESDSIEEAQEPDNNEEQQQDNHEWGEKPETERDGQQIDIEEDGEIIDRRGDNWEEQDNQDKEMNEQENKERCKKECTRPCVEKCIRESCGNEMDCNIDEESKKCESDCVADKECIEKCMQGGDWWKEYQNTGEEFKQEKGVFQAGGNCRTSQGKTDGFIWFGGWGEPFEQIQYIKNKYYQQGQEDWCKYELENIKKQREEFENSFDEEFAKWFFEKYLANSAEDWEQHVSGIFELYWNDVDMSRRMAELSKCLDSDSMFYNNLINVKYETEYGKLEFWEEIKSAAVPGIEGKTEIISPYMKVWIFPSKEFMIYEMKESMKNHEFPGKSEDKLERKNEEGLTEEEKRELLGDKKLMQNIKEVAEKYNGNLKMAVQFKDYETDKIVFNLYAQVNENDIIKIEPMLPEEMPKEDVRVELDFAILYDMIYTSEKEMQGERVESPPWDKKFNPIQKIKDVTNGAKIYFKVRSLMGSAKYYPENSEKDVKNFLELFLRMMGPGSEKPGDMEQMPQQDEEKTNEKAGWDSKESLTGQVIAEF